MRKAALFWAALFLGGSTLAMAADFTGTWNANLTKSSGYKVSEIESYKVTIKEIGPNTYRTTLDVVGKSGKKTHDETDRIYDGKEHHVTANGKVFEATQICEFTGEGGRKITWLKDGKPSSVLTSIISKDGTTMTNRETTAKGEIVWVLEKE